MLGVEIPAQSLIQSNVGSKASFLPNFFEILEVFEFQAVDPTVEFSGIVQLLLNDKSCLFAVENVIVLGIAKVSQDILCVFFPQRNQFLESQRVHQ